MKKYGVLGSHGSGKSALSYILASYFKTLDRNVDIVQERVRYSPFPFNDKMTIDTALWIYHTHIARELEAKARKFDTIICDRTPLDSFIYAEYFGLDSKEINFCKHHAIKWLETYEQLFFINPDVSIIADGVRGTDPEYQKGIHNLFEEHIELIEKYMKINIKRINTSEIFNDNLIVECLINSYVR